MFFVAIIFLVFFFRLQVHYPPHVTLTSDKGDLLEEGERVRFRCEASANPAQLSYAWYIAGRRVAEAPDASTELVLGKLYFRGLIRNLN